MGSVQVGAILQKARAFHQELSRFYDSVQQQADKERVKLLLTYFSHHEKRVEESLRKFEETVAREVLDTWFKYSTDMSEPCALESIQVSPGMTVDEAVAMATRFEDCLLRLYRGAAENAGTPEVREIFLGLVTLTERERNSQVEQGDAVRDL
jgi:rubrerythrin